MGTLRRRAGKWQSMMRIAGHPQLIKTFDKHEDAKRWQLEAELKIRREEADIAKVKFPLFRDIGLRYLNEVSVHKKCFRDKRAIINSLLQEVWAEYPLNRISPNIISKYRDRQRKTVKENTINRRLDVVSAIFTTCKKEWDYQPTILYYLSEDLKILHQETEDLLMRN